MQATLADAAAPLLRAAGGSARAVPMQNFHLTLAFLGSVSLERVGAVGRVAVKCSQAFSAGASPVTLVFDTVEHWRKPQILCATAHEAPAAGVQLSEALKQALVAEEFAPDITKPFRPHVTLARKAVHAPREQSIVQVEWTFTEFALVQSRTAPEGSVYTVLESYRFTTRAAPQPARA